MFIILILSTHSTLAAAASENDDSSSYEEYEEEDNWFGGTDDLPEIDFDETYSFSPDDMADSEDMMDENAHWDDEATLRRKLQIVVGGEMKDKKKKMNGYPLMPLPPGKVTAVEVSAVRPLKCGSRVDLYGGDIYWVQTPSYPIQTNNPADR